MCVMCIYTEEKERNYINSHLCFFFHHFKIVEIKPKKF